MESSWLEQDLLLLEGSPSPIVQALLGFLRDVIGVKGAVLLEEKYSLTSLAQLYTEGGSSTRLIALPADKGGYVSVILTRDHKYYLIYFPQYKNEEEMAAIKKIYEGFTPHDPKDTVDTRTLTFEVDVTIGQVGARLTTLLQDYSSSSKLISSQYFRPHTVGSLPSFIQKIREALEGATFQIEEELFARPSTNDEFPLF